MRRFVRSAARQDIERQFRHYLLDHDAPEVAMRFLDAVEKVLTAVSRDPGIGSPRFFRNLPGLRSWPVPGFEDIRVYYVETPNIVRVVRVLHGSRDLSRVLKQENILLD